MKTLTLGAALAASAALCACGEKTETPPASAASASGAPESCTSYVAGQDGVIRTFCTGSATVKVNVDGKDYLLSGGDCEQQMGMLALNIGVVTGSSAPPPRPDYVGITVMDGKESAFSNAVVAVNVGGEGLALTRNSGTFTLKGGTFEGTAMGSGRKVTGSFTC